LQPEGRDQEDPSANAPDEAQEVASG
jgi:hypothetical protein